MSNHPKSRGDSAERAGAGGQGDSVEQQVAAFAAEVRAIERPSD
jgi:hypothetical protein